MKRWVVVTFLLLVGFGSKPAHAAAPGELFTLHRPITTEATLPGRPVPGLRDIRQITSPGQKLWLNAAERNSLQKNIQYKSLFTPNDPHFSLQWNLQTMHVPSAWDVDQSDPIHGGDNRVIVAVLDSGLASTIVGGAASVPDITSTSIWTNGREIRGDGIDNDGNGYVDDVHGWNFVSNNFKPADDNGHGTHIAGVIAAGLDNGIATAGIASNVTIMPLKVLDDRGLGTTATLTAAVRYAVTQGASIINLSLGGDEDDPIFHQAIQTAIAQGIIVIAAAGNSGASDVTFPARYSEVIGVGATNTNNTRASYSNYGPALTLVAPGGDTAVDLNSDGQPDGIPSQTCATAQCLTFITEYMSGTSQAAAEVSAVAALLESCGAASDKIKSLMTDSALDLGAPGRDDQFGAGQVDAAGALTAAGCVIGSPASPGSIVGTASRTSSLQLQAQRPSPYTHPVFAWSHLDGTSFDVTWKKGSTTLAKVRQTASDYSPTLQDEGLYTVSVIAVDALGQKSPASTFEYRYQKPVIILSYGSTVSLLTASLSTIRTFSTTIATALDVHAGWLGDTFVSRLFVAAHPRGSTMTIVDTKGKKISSLQPFGTKFFGGLSGRPLTITHGMSKYVIATATNGASIAWYSAPGTLLGRNQVFSHYSQGINMATGDLNGDGNDEVIVAQTVGSEIRVYSSARTRLAVFSPRGKSYTKGWSIAVGDVDGDGRAEIVATPNVAGQTQKVLILDGTGHELRHFSITGSMAGPMLLQAMDVTGDGRSEILTAPQQGRGQLQILSATGKVLRQLKLGPTSFRSLSGL